MLDIELEVGFVVGAGSTGDPIAPDDADRHVFGVFPRATWLAQMAAAGFEAATLPFEHSQVEPGLIEMFLGRKG